MKPFIISILFSAFSSLLFAQTINDIPLSEIDVEYVQIVGTAKLFSKKVTIQLDFGQETKYFKARETILKDNSGNRIIFNSMVDALNFMNQNGYDFKTAYALTIGNSNVYHFLLQKNNL